MPQATCKIIDFNRRNCPQSVCRRALLTMGATAEWASILGLSGDLAERTIKAWAEGKCQIPDKFIILIIDAADLLFDNSSEMQMDLFAARKEILKRGKP